MCVDFFKNQVTGQILGVYEDQRNLWIIEINISLVMGCYFCCGFSWIHNSNAVIKLSIILDIDEKKYSIKLMMKSVLDVQYFGLHNEAIQRNEQPWEFLFLWCNDTGDLGSTWNSSFILNNILEYWLIWNPRLSALEQKCQMQNGLMHQNLLKVGCFNYCWIRWSSMIPIAWYMNVCVCSQVKISPLLLIDAHTYGSRLQVLQSMSSPQKHQVVTMIT